MSRVLVHTRTECEFCTDGVVQLHNLTVNGRSQTPCYHCEGKGYFERWDVLESLINLLILTNRLNR